MEKQEFTDMMRDKCIHLAALNKWDDLYDYLSGLNISLIKFQSLKYIESVYKDSLIYLSPVNRFNDRFDCCWNTKEDCEGMYNACESKLKQQKKSVAFRSVYKKMEYEMQNWVKGMHVACFSESSNLQNLRMWYDYANKYRGICVEYSVSDLINAIQKYNDDFRAYSKIFKEQFRLTFLSPVRYVDSLREMPSLHDIDSNNMCRDDIVRMNNHSVLCAKANCWQDEKEWRICDPNVELELKPQSILRIWRCAGEFICKPIKVYFGPKIQNFNRSKLLKVFSEKDIECYDTYFNYVNLTLDIKRIEDI